MRPWIRPIKRFYRRARHKTNQWLGRDVHVPIQHTCRYERFGNEYGGWCICPDKLSRESVIYSVGVGEDISFDLALIDRLGVQVHAFDPTPKSIKWIKRQTLPPQFHFHELGLADFDGAAQFALPRPDFVSFTMDPEHAGAKSEIIDAQVRRLSTLTRSLGHNAIDVLKMDIEGAEYAVINDLAQTRFPVGQLLVEFHHAIGRADEVARTFAAIKTLNEIGYALFYNSPGGREYSFIRLPDAI